MSQLKLMPKTQPAPISWIWTVLSLDIERLMWCFTCSVSRNRSRTKQGKIKQSGPTICYNIEFFCFLTRKRANLVQYLLFVPLFLITANSVSLNMACNGTNDYSDNQIHLQLSTLMSSENQHSTLSFVEAVISNTRPTRRSSLADLKGVTNSWSLLCWHHWSRNASPQTTSTICRIST